MTTIKRSDLPTIGKLMPEHGGVFAGILCRDISVNGDRPQPVPEEDYALFIPTDPAADLGKVAWGEYGDVGGARHINDGLANTLAMSQAGNHLAQRALGLQIGNHADFYLPARGELMLAFLNCRDLFDPSWYWSSTQYSAGYAWYQFFDGGFQYDLDKKYEGRARVVRRSIIV